MFHVISPVELVLLIPVQVQPFHVIADGGFEESQLYYTTPQPKKQAGNAGNAREKVIFPADFLPGACRTGGEDEVVSRRSTYNLCFRPKRFSAKKT